MKINMPEFWDEEVVLNAMRTLDAYDLYEFFGCKNSASFSRMMNPVFPDRPAKMSFSKYVRDNTPEDVASSVSENVTSSVSESVIESITSSVPPKNKHTAILDKYIKDNIDLYNISKLPLGDRLTKRNEMNEYERQYYDEFLTTLNTLKVNVENFS